MSLLSADHLVFLAVLLLPAPLAAVGRGWREEPSLRGTLTRAGLLVAACCGGFALGVVLSGGVPAVALEMLVAAATVVAAVHAVRPLARHGSAWLAGLLGVLSGASLAPPEVLGTGLALLAAVAVLLPLVVLVSRSRAYPGVRVVVAVAGVVVAGASGIAALAGGESVLQPLFDVVAGDPSVSLLVLAAAAFLVWELFPPVPAEESPVPVEEAPVPAEREPVGVR
ncbi:hypothetical protein QOZ88_17480 [Blastococcus sp. BMG 814]|uniref:Uncharacterized protein n=1 Tax=Blastococcus carthaginiensis TaxID=3050034 RepID=A0ABT9IFS4_9ACTN|nr:hypothetical protein [Blastococcus carthaginiensis]MDP5184430.1 hypothetical protein [Blastococcus carthaginiensis]